MGSFLSFLICAPIFATAFGFLIWLLPAMALRDVVARHRPGLFGYLTTGYVFIALMSLYLLLSADHQVGPILGTAVSFAIVWVVRDRRRGLPLIPRLPIPLRRGAGHKGGPDQGRTGPDGSEPDESVGPQG